MHWSTFCPVTSQAVIRRAYHCGILSDCALKQLGIERHRRGCKKPEPESPETDEHPFRFERLIRRACAEDAIRISLAPTSMGDRLWTSHGGLSSMPDILLHDASILLRVNMLGDLTGKRTPGSWFVGRRNPEGIRDLRRRTRNRRLLLKPIGLVDPPESLVFFRCGGLVGAP